MFVCLHFHAGTLGVLVPCRWKQPSVVVMNGVHKNGIWGKYNQNNELKEARNHLSTVDVRVLTHHHLIPLFSNRGPKGPLVALKRHLVVLKCLLWLFFFNEISYFKNMWYNPSEV